MARENENLESSYLALKTKVTMMEKELDRLRKLTSEISHFMFLDDGLWHPYKSVNNEATLGGESSKSGGAAMGKERTVYLMDEWRNMDPSDKDHA
ncbi:hypothetical protein HID58_039736 [Brassica napus]|uniref:Uncharacterized protein n=1 Tax=Brassica napus TaxID=3708 RepID=A0ABQ8BSY8_BRANA|nr:hypothetical protein HID58_039736 [Brassica napus]